LTVQLSRKIHQWISIIYVSFALVFGLGLIPHSLGIHGPISDPWLFEVLLQLLPATQLPCVIASGKGLLCLQSLL